MGNLCGRASDSEEEDDQDGPTVDVQEERNATLLDFLMDPEEDDGPNLLKIKKH